jgi:tripartite-type tricarboxylate transporter receptor subunit TctC
MGRADQGERLQRRVMEAALAQFRFLVAALAVLAALGQAGAAEGDKAPVRLIVGVSAGGSIDLLARQLADKMKDILGEPVVVENRSGANQRIALAEVRKSPPDARTLYIGTSGPFSILPNIYGDKLEYDPIKDFTPVARLVHFDLAIAVGPSTPAKSLSDLVAWLKANPDKATYGTPGAGTTSHFVGVMFAGSINAKLTHVPYKGGTPAINDLVGGHIPMLINSLADMMEQHKAGNLRIVAATGPKRSTLLPDIPTLKESGVDVAVDIAIDAYGSGNIPPAAVKRMNAALIAALGNADVLQRILTYGLLPAPSSPEELARKQVEETKLWAAPIKASGFTGE